MKKYLFVGLSLALATSLMATEIVAGVYKPAGKTGCCTNLVASGSSAGMIKSGTVPLH